MHCQTNPPMFFKTNKNPYVRLFPRNFACIAPNLAPLPSFQSHQPHVSCTNKILKFASLVAFWQPNFVNFIYNLLRAFQTIWSRHVIFLVLAIVKMHQVWYLCIECQNMYFKFNEEKTVHEDCQTITSISLKIRRLFNHKQTKFCCFWLWCMWKTKSSIKKYAIDRFCCNLDIVWMWY